MPDPIDLSAAPEASNTINIKGGVRVNQGNFIGGNQTTYNIGTLNLIGFENHIERQVQERLQSAARKVIPAHLPQRVNRYVQIKALEDFYQQVRSRPQAFPIVGIVHGDENQAHDAFLGRLPKEIVPYLLQIKPTQPPPYLFRLLWPSYLPKINDVEILLTQELSGAVVHRPGATLEEMQYTLAAYDSPAIVLMELLSSDWVKHQASILESILTFWNSWPPLAPRQTLFVFLYITYKMPKLNWFQRRSHLEQKKQICMQLKDCDFGRYSRLHCTVLPELGNVVEAETRHWMRIVADEFLDGNSTRLQSKIGVLFAKSPSIPMNDLITELEEILTASGLA